MKTLINLAELLVKHQRYKPAIFILKYLEQLNLDDRQVTMDIIFIKLYFHTLTLSEDNQ
jgi:hypothetical protein